MSWAWVVPAALAGAGALAAAVVGWRTASAAAALRRDLEGLAALRPALVEARDEVTSAARELRRLHGH